MNKNTPYLTVLLILVFSLSGCVANKEMAQVIDHLHESNTQALVIIKHLHIKDEGMTALVLDRNKQLKKLALAQVKQQYSLNLASLRLAVIDVNAEINKSFESTKQACLNAVVNESKNLSSLVSEAEQQAAALHAESLKFSDDKVLELQAAKAAADYFGRLNSFNTIAGEAKENCNKKLKLEKAKAGKRIDAFLAIETAQLTQVQTRKIQEISASKFIEITSNSELFEALIAWNRENEIAYNNASMHMQTNNILSPEGVLSTAIKSVGKGVIAGVLGKNVESPSATDVLNSGKALVESFTSASKAEFSSKLLEAKQGLTTIKGNIGNNLKAIVQSTALAVLRKKAEK